MLSPSATLPRRSGCEGPPLHPGRRWARLRALRPGSSRGGRAGAWPVWAMHRRPPCADFRRRQRGPRQPMP
eukprot:2232286-Pyramimonas_sp.AAC.1